MLADEGYLEKIGVDEATQGKAEVAVGRLWMCSRAVKEVAFAVHNKTWSHNGSGSVGGRGRK